MLLHAKRDDPALSAWVGAPKAAADPPIVAAIIAASVSALRDFFENVCMILVTVGVETGGYSWLFHDSVAAGAEAGATVLWFHRYPLFHR